MEDIKTLIGLLIALIGTAGGLSIPFMALYIDQQKRKIIHKERMALIEKGINPLPPTTIKTSSGNLMRTTDDPLLWGLLFAGVGAGLLAGYFIAMKFVWNTTILMNGSAILLGGLALLSYYFIKENRIKKEN